MNEKWIDLSDSDKNFKWLNWLEDSSNLNIAKKIKRMILC